MICHECAYVAQDGRSSSVYGLSSSHETSKKEALTGLSLGTDVSSVLAAKHAESGVAPTLVYVQQIQYIGGQLLPLAKGSVATGCR